MARFMATIQGQRGEASRLGSPNSGIRASINGWDSGVNVDGHANRADGADYDRFIITVTNGSNGGGSDCHIGEVINKAFYPSQAVIDLVLAQHANKP